ncbi:MULTISPECIES: peptidoglycan-binding protein [unclassified Streptomyces]|uniref:peptidoglycan-binding protein n=1 Tax=unclassified Streptomyces TaxID=2593676 RepID=UPI001F0D535A|nr:MULTISPECIES: peptidoglycan-binding protein [unclassified Streptomyces]
MVLKSPAQVAIETAPPRPNILTAPVVRKVLAQSVVTRGKVTPSQSFDITSSGAPKEAGRSVVTDVMVKAGQKISYGHAMVEVSGRPIFLMKGPIPAYRDLMPGAKGRDVKQLQDALAGLGYSLGRDVSGTFGKGTEGATKRFYRSMGYAPATAEVAVQPPTPSASVPKTDGKAEVLGSETVSVFPLAEISFVDAPSVRVGDVKATVGSEPNGVLLSVTTGSLTIDASVAAYEKGLIRPGQDVEILSEASGKQAKGKVSSVAQAPTKPQSGESGQAGETYAVHVKPSAALPSEFNGADVRLTIVAASSRDEVLAVPSSAISAGADGQMFVTVRRAQLEHRVAVRVGMTGDGFVQISPVSDLDVISQGDQVVIGVQPSDSSGKL